MACALTQNYTLDCKDSIGGLKEVYFAAVEDVASWTGSAGTYTAVTMDAGKYFWKYDLVKESSNFAEAVNTNVQNGTVFYAQTLEIILNKLQVNTRNEILLLAKNNLVAIVKDNNDAQWILGFSNGLDITGGGSATGTAFGDRNGYTLTFTGNEKELAGLFTGTPPQEA
jgi:hypothetical protein